MTTHLALQRILLPSAQVSSLTTGSITLPSARGAFQGRTGKFESIASYQATGSQSTINFTSIPSTYQHLQIRMSVLDGGTTGISEFYVRLNNDGTGGNYWKMRWYADASTTTASTGAVSSEGAWGSPSSRASCVQYAHAIIDFHDYASSTKYKDIISRGYGMTASSNSVVGSSSSPWLNTSPISQITLDCNMGTWGSSSIFSLYGIKGS